MLYFSVIYGIDAHFFSVLINKFVFLYNQNYDMVSKVESFLLKDNLSQISSNKIKKYKV